MLARPVTVMPAVAIPTTITRQVWRSTTPRLYTPPASPERRSRAPASPGSLLNGSPTRTLSPGRKLSPGPSRYSQSPAARGQRLSSPSRRQSPSSPTPTLSPGQRRPAPPSKPSEAVAASSFTLQQPSQFLEISKQSEISAPTPSIPTSDISKQNETVMAGAFVPGAFLPMQNQPTPRRSQSLRMPRIEAPPDIAESLRDPRARAQNAGTLKFTPRAVTPREVPPEQFVGRPVLPAQIVQAPAQTAPLYEGYVQRSQSAKVLPSVEPTVIQGGGQQEAFAPSMWVEVVRPLPTGDRATTEAGANQPRKGLIAAVQPASSLQTPNGIVGQLNLGSNILPDLPGMAVTPLQVTTAARTTALQNLPGSIRRAEPTASVSASSQISVETAAASEKLTQTEAAEVLRVLS